MKLIKLTKSCCNVASKSFSVRRISRSVTLHHRDESREKWREARSSNWGTSASASASASGGAGLLPSNRSPSEPSLMLAHQSRSFSNAGEKIPAATTETKTSKEDDWGGPEAEKLIIHFKENLTDSIKAYDSLLLYFYTSWCRHCRKFKSTYGAAAVRMKEEGVAGQLAAVDLTKRMEIADLFNVASVPQLHYFRKGEFIRVYNEKRTVDDILKFMKNPPTEPVIVPSLDI